MTRAFVALICLALLLLCAVVSPSASHLDLAIPALVFCLAAALRLSRLDRPDPRRAAQPRSFLGLHTSRAPPLA